MLEEWKDVKGYEGLYLISNTGRIKHYTVRNGWHELKETNSKGWYLTVRLFDSNREPKSTRIHELVAEHFLGEIPKGFHVHHKDGNKQNNVADNLEIIDPVQHAKETYKQKPYLYDGMKHYNIYEKPKHIIQKTLSGDFVAEYANSIIAGKYTGVCARNILQVANRQEGRTQAGGFKWEFAKREGVV